MCTLRAICFGHWLTVDWMMWVFWDLIFRTPYDINPCLVKLSHLQAVVALCWLLTLLCTGTRQSALGIVPGPRESLPRAGSGKVPPVFPWLSRLISQGLLPRFNARSEGSGLVFLLWISSFLCCFFSTVFLTHLSKTGWLSSSFAGVLFHWWAGVFCTRTVLGSPVAVWCDTSSGTEILWYLSIALCRSLCVRICIRIAFLVPWRMHSGILLGILLRLWIM